MKLVRTLGPCGCRTVYLVHVGDIPFSYFYG